MSDYWAGYLLGSLSGGVVTAVGAFLAFAALAGNCRDARFAATRLGRENDRLRLELISMRSMNDAENLARQHNARSRPQG